MSELVGIVGATGSGKSTSVFPNEELKIQGLDPKSTVIISVAGKPLPFKGWKKIYNPSNGNLLVSDDPIRIVKALKGIHELESNKHVKHVVIDDFQYLMAFEYMEKAIEPGWDKFSVMAKHAFDVLNVGRKLREDLTVYVLTHSDEIQKDFETVRKMKTLGKMLDNVVTLEGLFTVCLYAHTEWDSKQEKGSYYFVTNRTSDYPAKSPVGMFNSIMIPNDLGFVSQKINEYNN